MPKRSPTVICYICGREFGSRSIAIHEPQCLKKWHLENERLPTNLRRSPPKRPEVPWMNDDSSCENFKQMAWKSANDNLVPCQHCKRTFKPDRLPVHQKSCKTSARNSKEVTKPEQRKSKSTTTTTSTTALNEKGLTKPTSKTNIKTRIHRDITFTRSKDSVSNSSSCDNCQPENSMSDIHKRVSGSESSSTDLKELKMADKMADPPASKIQNRACYNRKDMKMIDEAFIKQSEFNLKGSGEAMAITCGTCGQEICENNLSYHMTACKPQVQPFNVMKNPVAKRLLVQANPRTQIYPIEKLEPVTACSSQFFPNFKQKAPYQGNNQHPFYSQNTYNNARKSKLENLIRQDTKICPKCSVCLPESELFVHQKYCRPYGKKSKPLKMVPSMGQMTRRPTVMCNLCGREYGSKSISIHEPQCRKKLRMQNQNYPYQSRRAEGKYLDLPVFQGKGAYNLTTIYDPEYQVPQSNLVPCQVCRRTFYPDRLAVHQKSCRPKRKGNY